MLQLCYTGGNTLTNTPTPDYNITITPTMKIMLREAAEQGARAAISEIMKSGMNLDKTKQTNEERPLSERDNDMARIKQCVTLPTGEAIWCTGESIGDMLSNLLSRLSMNPPAAKKPAPTLRAFVDTVYRPNFIKGLAATTCANYETYLAQYISKNSLSAEDVKKEAGFNFITGASVSGTAIHKGVYAALAQYAALGGAK